MSTNVYLNAAKAAKNDEFYTRYEDVALEVGRYAEQFSGKSVYCNCDDPENSNFWNYFKDNFEKFRLRELMATHCAREEKESYLTVYDGSGESRVLIRSDGHFPAGDFRSRDCLRFLDLADIVCTNEPFSLFRQYIQQLIRHQKQFLIIGNMNAITYKEVFPLIKGNQLWLGYTQPKKFLQPGGSIKNFGNIVWYTNMDVQNRRDGLWHTDGKLDPEKMKVRYQGNAESYLPYDNYRAVEVSRISSIPCDYEGVMGVPITILFSYSPAEFEILGADEAEGTGFSNGLFVGGSGRRQCYVNGKHVYKRIFIRNLHPVCEPGEN